MSKDLHILHNTKKMYFYVSLLLISNIFILAVHTQSKNSTVHTQSKNSTALGISSCTYIGGLEKDCNSNVNISDIPKTCTAIIVDGFYMDITYNMDLPDGEDGLFDALDEILKNSNNVFILYGHQTQEEWTQILGCEECNNGTNSKDEIAGLKVFLNQHPGINGVLISNLEFDKYSVAFPKYSENVKVYLDTMKSTLTNLTVGLFLNGKFLIDQFNNPIFPWLDFTILDSSVDFYVIDVVSLNDCSNQFRLVGTTPINSANITPPTNYTLNNLKDVLANLSIPQGKTYYKYGSYAKPQDDSIPMCNTTNTQMCSNPNSTSSWCADTIQTYNDKGKFSKDFGAGFVVTFIELDDPNGTCNCGPYPSFNAILNGYNDNTTNTDNSTQKCILSSRS